MYKDHQFVSFIGYRDQFVCINCGQLRLVSTNTEQPKIKVFVKEKENQFIDLREEDRICKI